MLYPLSYGGDFFTFRDNYTCGRPPTYPNE